MTCFRRLFSFYETLTTPCAGTDHGDRSGDVVQSGSHFFRWATPLMLVILLLLALGCPPLTTSDDDDDGDSGADTSICSTDSDCRSGEKCVEGTCVEETAACIDDLDCNADEICVEGSCVLECDPPCEPGQSCVEGLCFEETTECIDDLDCNADEICVEGSCTVGTMSCTVDTDCNTGERCVNNICTAPTPPSFTLSTGTFTIPSLDNLEGMANLGNLPYANFTGEGPAVAFSGFGDTAVLNLVTQEILLDLRGSGIPRFGVAGISLDPPGQNSSAAILSYGPNLSFGGFLVQYFPVDGQFSSFGQLLTGATGFDAIPFGGDVVSTGMTYTALNGVSFIAFNSTSAQFDPTNELLAPGDFSGASGIPVSAFVDTPGGPALVLFGDPGFNQAGEVWFHDRSTLPLAPAFAVQNDPRKLRCQLPICAVSNFGSNSLSIFTWDGTTPPASPTTVSTCDGPLGLDITQLTDGNFAIVAPCFNDNMVNETVVQPNAAEVSNTQTPVDSTCLNPGHALWVADSEGLKILASCFGSNNYVIMPSNQ